MKPFLQKVAEAYAENDASCLYRYCFVLPNRRSRAFFESYLSEALHERKSVLPELTTISDFIDSQLDLVEAGRVEQLLLLYETYRQIAERDKKQYSDFDHFLHIGDMILSDFNDIDRYMIDARELFANMKNLNGIQTDYLTDEQRAVIKEYWGVDKKPMNEDSLFVQTSYIDLWDNMYELYAAFQETLSSRGLTYSGWSYRSVAESIKDMSAADFHCDRIVMVGFSTLSKAEESIFVHLKNLGIADFYWDFESAFFDEKNKGSYFLSRYVKEFPSRYDIMDHKDDITVPNINILSVPSGSGQGLVVGDVLQQLVDSGKLDPADAVDTAVVLPEEKYVNSVLDSIPDIFKTINITMGMPVDQSPIASFLSSLVALERKKKEIKGETCYFYEDVEMLASHPYAYMVAGGELDNLILEIRRKNAYFVPMSMIAEGRPRLADLFDTEGGDPMAYLEQLLATINKQLEENGKNSIERYFVTQYAQALTQIKNTIARFGIALEKRSLFFILSRSMSGSIVPFEGKPLQGLQVMGVLETRLLDFKNIIVLSMNEKIFPTKHYTKSFIPNGIRSAYGLSTYKHQDSMYAYYFYRMISRAENVFLLYDSRVQGTAGGEESRYVKQLTQVYNRGHNKHVIYDYSVIGSEPELVSVKKSERIMRVLRQFQTITDGEKPRYLSASSINTYIDCPLKFYLQKIEGFQEEQEVTDFIDSSTFGQVVHGVMERLYAGNSLVNAKFFDRYIKEAKVNGVTKWSATIELEKVVAFAVNKYYKRRDESQCSAKLTGEAVLIAKIVMYYVVNTLVHDHRLGGGEFVYVAGEKQLAFNWDMGDGVEMNFKCFIDRIDKVDGKLRIVDYKTGSDEVAIKKPDDGFADLFEGDSKGIRQKAILQLLLYCNAYAFHEHYSDDIQPVIYKLKDIDTCLNGEFVVMKPKHAKVEGYKSDLDNDVFMDRMRSVVSEIFDPAKPFTQTKHRDKCLYCQFAKLCSRDE